LQVREPGLAACEWWPQVEALRGVDRLAFRPVGLTVLWGPNGCGKSTVLKTMARLTHCEQGGASRITQSSVWELQAPTPLGDRQRWRDGVRLVHDGEPVHFLDPSQEPGLRHGVFDDDFFSDGMLSLEARRSSSGQNVTGLLNRVLEMAAKAEGIGSTLNRDTVNPVWRANFEKMNEMLAPAEVDGKPLPPGPRTLLLDEPDRSLSLPRQKDLWDTLAAQQRFQIIVATHSVFALDVPGVRYVDLQPGYLAECREALGALCGRGEPSA